MSTETRGLLLDNGASWPLQANHNLHQRSEAETLLLEFARAQLTRHYRGEFAGSAGSRTICRTAVAGKSGSGAVRTRLWIEPLHRKEAYLEEVERLGRSIEDAPVP